LTLKCFLVCFKNGLAFHTSGVDKVGLFVYLKYFIQKKNSLAFYLDGGVMAFSLSWSVERVGWFLKHKNIYFIYKMA
jgi:hypothetical protein